jgi:hypothetical protein
MKYMTTIREEWYIEENPEDRKETGEDNNPLWL